MKTATATDRLTRLEAELANIHQQITAIRAEGEIIHARIEYAAPGGTAGAPSQQKAKYARLMWGRGKSRQSRYVPLEEIPRTVAAVDRGKAIAKLERQAAKLTKQITAIKARDSRPAAQKTQGHRSAPATDTSQQEGLGVVDAIAIAKKRGYRGTHQQFLNWARTHPDGLEGSFDLKMLDRYTFVDLATSSLITSP